MTLLELYQSWRTDGENGEKARQLLSQMHWFTLNADFDPKTGEALPQTLSAFLAKVAHPKREGTIQDRLYRITEHVRPSLERLFRSLNESPRREQALMPVHAVTELDANSFIKLSKRPGRNIREKLAGKPYLQAVRRYQSVNLSENRLLKAFVTRLAELFELRRDCLGGEEDEMLPKIKSWLLSDEAQEIDPWENLPPNNTLLSHRDYGCVWDAWRWLQTLDKDIDRDCSQLEARKETMRTWDEYGQKYFDGTYLFAEMPVLFDYEKFEIRPWPSQIVFQEVTQKIVRYYGKKEIFEPVCVDLAVLRPRYATTKATSTSLCETYLWQQWRCDVESVDIELFNSDAAYLHPYATSIFSTDLFFSKDNTLEHLDRAARVFSYKLRETFKDETLIWLVPDSLNDFELEITRRNINACFPNAEPLPRSVAAVFEQVEYSKIKNDGYRIVVVDAIGGTTCATKLVARFDADLKKRIPETNGYYWERCPEVIISESDARKERPCDMVTVDGNGKWHRSAAPERPQCIDARRLKADKRIGSFEDLLTLSDSPVAGGIRLHSLQSRAGEIPLWRDQIPELSMKVMKDGRYQRFDLVSRGTTIKPIRGLSVQIPIAGRFTLPAGKRFYQFPLLQGENAAELRFSARLNSSAFPLKSKTECELILTFQYGDDEPYNLLVDPLDKSFPPVRITWQRTVEEIVTDAPAPAYPTPMSWEGLRRFPDSNNGGTIDLVAELGRTNGNFTKWFGWNNERGLGNIRKSIKGWCRFLVISIWRDGCSVLDLESPMEFKNAAKGFQSLLSKISTTDLKTVSDVRFLESCMHKDAPDECVKWVSDQVEGGHIRDRRAVGFALGDVSQVWQKYVFDCLASNPSHDAISVFAYAIWRERNFVTQFSHQELKAIFSALVQRIEGVRPPKISKNAKDEKWVRIHWVRTTAEPLELLLGLLRTRVSVDPEIRMLLQPHQKIAKQFAEQIDRIEEIVAESNITLFSRVQIDVQKPEGVRTPDLLYALRLYLTGDDGANAIHISGISDSDSD